MLVRTHTHTMYTQKTHTFSQIKTHTDTCVIRYITSEHERPIVSWMTIFLGFHWIASEKQMDVQTYKDGEKSREVMWKIETGKTQTNSYRYEYSCTDRHFQLNLEKLKLRKERKI